MKNRLFARSLIVMVFAVIALVLGGCKMNGGGWIKKSNGKKVNFGFNFKAECDDNGHPNVSGQLQFNDREKGVRFHGVADSVPWNPCTCNASYSWKWDGGYSGSYTPQPRKLGKGGKFAIYLKDNGEPGPTKGDLFTLRLTGGIYNGYSLDGALEGGNIQTHEDKEEDTESE